MLQRGGGRGHETDPMYSSMQAPKVGTRLVGNTGGTVPVQCFTVPVQNTERPSSASNRRDSLSVASVVCRVRLAQASSATLETLGGSDGEVGGFQGSWTVQGVLNSVQESVCICTHTRRWPLLETHQPMYGTVRSSAVFADYRHR